MIENREKEWCELEQKALQMLENPRLLPLDEITKHFDPILHLWIAPSFTPRKQWVFYKPHINLNPQPQPLVRELFWNRQKDYSRLCNPLVGLKEGFDKEPRMQFRSHEINQNVLENLLETLAKITLPVFVRDDSLCLDGVRFGIETFGFFNSAKIVWWSSYPEEWQDLVNWFEKTTKYLETEFSKINDC